MLNDEKARFSVKDVGIVVSLSAAFAFAYSDLKTVNKATADRVAAVERQLSSRELASVPARMTRLEYILCATDDKARSLACERMGVLK